MNATLFDAVDAAMPDAKLVAWDGCHKIYLAMDNIEAAWFAAEYPHIVVGSPEGMTAAVRDWWDRSCSLKFVNAVTHNEENPNAGFVSLIGQGDWQDDEETCDECGGEVGYGSMTCDDCLDAWEADEDADDDEDAEDES